MKIVCQNRHAQMVSGYLDKPVSVPALGPVTTGEVVWKADASKLSKHEPLVFKQVCSRTYTFGGVYSDDPNHENKEFWDATPILTLQTTITNPAVDFEVGAEYNIEISKANTRTSSNSVLKRKQQ